MVSRMHLRRPAVLLLAATAVVGTMSVPGAAAGAPSPHITAASPTAGPTHGRNVVMIGGTHLDTVRTVTFGSVRSPKVTHVSSTSLAVTVPAHAAGTVTVHAGSATTRYRYTSTVRQLRWSYGHTIDPERGHLSGVSCGAKGFCVATDDGYGSGVDLVAFDAAGPIDTTAVPKARALDGVGTACAGRSFCVAFAGAWASQWTGAAWSAWHRVVDAKEGIVQLSCGAGADVCLAVTTKATYAVSGATWTALSLPTGAGLPTSVSCAAATFCVALEPKGALVYRGTSWQKAAAPAHIAKGRFTISCPTTSFCMSFGDYFSSDNSYATAVSTFDGTSWTSLPDYEGYDNPEDFACQSATLCVASLRSGVTWWRGKWSDARVPGVPEIGALSCADALCTVVDSNGMAAQHTTTRWTAPHRVSPSSGDLADVSCTTRAFCMAVDGHGQAVRYADGAWSAPRAVPGMAAFTAVSCAPGRTCMAVGGTSAALYRHGRWSAARVVDAGHHLRDVTCPTTTLCRAVDSAGRVLRWNGTGWTKPLAVGKGLTSIDCASTTRCLAVGTTTAALGASGWQRTKAPQRYGDLDSVDCVGTTWCAAAGSGGFYVWNRGVWSRPIHDEYGGAIDGTVACLPSRTCIGGLDNGADIWEYTFDGAKLDPTGSDLLYGENMSCVAGPYCTAVGLDYVITGKA